MHADDITEAGAGVFLVRGSDTNWVLVTEGEAVTLVDTGYPGDRDRLLASLAAIGRRPGDVAAILVTHAHTDHIGSAQEFGSVHGTPVLMHEAEVPHARRDFLHQVTPRQILANAWRPRVLPWALKAVGSGGTKDVRIAAPEAFPAPGALDLPGRPVPVATPGHTLGHSAYHLPDAGIVISGDALVSGHPTSGVSGPQLLPGMFHHDRDAARASLTVLAGLEADVVLPGHGPLHDGAVRAAAELAGERARLG
ncbi:MBL fold metallo-hydrolase [Nocardiopsis ansamitocini]|uniref:MBL fold metallo-hydrolase n=1 Tax=Nocardiopsis ansamitocini TaxID=1670832 RepID=A0A9W6P796_9ACTN|nr:MBL fold metallo-hydrolase [Nocardiopsis ansamitocini]GLU48790.1 MBL fold metallo-hydrolase [Nocardiopsis ansamitocini]